MLWLLFIHHEGYWFNHIICQYCYFILWVPFESVFTLVLVLWSLLLASCYLLGTMLDCLSRMWCVITNMTLQYKYDITLPVTDIMIPPYIACDFNFSEPAFTAVFAVSQNQQFVSVLHYCCLCFRGKYFLTFFDLFWYYYHISILRFGSFYILSSTFYLFFIRIHFLIDTLLTCIFIHIYIHIYFYIFIFLFVL